MFLRSSSSLLLRPLFLVATNSLLPAEEDVVEDEVDAIADDTLLVNIFFPLSLSRRRGVHERARLSKIKLVRTEREREREIARGDETWRNEREPTRDLSFFLR